ncbi:50S ribosomal protein L28 [Planctopirus ephydatiae]|uniref:Large ribosomal subunit protein bL28 n=1 Tax=Planctopirus ephydatiae TaxID=2528019 RepID=A0A518GRA3_9PLAN|nr:50S ribosomal protein L28 [Planctopirus ephydatiae]QDV31120.1 50S ribosomal protein L28 [Planctopirus ephydatiae]
MGAQCDLCSKSVTFGNTLQQRGKAKYLGGNGRKTTGISRRVFRPNLQSVNVQVGERSQKMMVCVKCIRSGVVAKKVVRKPFTLPTV